MTVAPFKVEALEAEANGDGWEFEFDGDIYVMPPDFDIRVAAKLTSGDLLGGLQELLGPEQWGRIDSSPKIFSVAEMTRMLNAWCSHLGVDLGEFVASPSSSKKTVAPSKRTSNGSTASRSRTSSRARRG